MLFAGVVAMAACSAHADNPGYDRPGYGFTPVVLGAGDITLEQGMPDASRSTQDGTTTTLYSADSLLRVGVGGPFELQLGTSLWNTLQTSGNGADATYHGRGDSTLGMKFALPARGVFSWGLLANVEFTDGAKALRSDRPVYLLGAQFNWQASDKQQLGAYLQDARSGGIDSTTYAIGDSIAWSKTFSTYIEAAHLHGPQTGNGLVAGAGVAWMLNQRVQLDAGFDRRVSGSATAWQTNLGVSVYFGR